MTDVIFNNPSSRRLSTLSDMQRGRRRILARYDAAQTTTENSRHWAMADGLSALAAHSTDVRRLLRNRARYEVANNTYAQGIVRTLADYVVGTGPRLQMTGGRAALNQRVEREFEAWAKAVSLSAKLHLMRSSQAMSGEVFCLLTTNEAIPGPVKLDLRIIESDQVAAPLGVNNDDADGIEFDSAGNPSIYYVLRSHPGDSLTLGSSEYDIVQASQVIHLYRPERPGQVRGVPEITPALPLFALLRRYTLAVLGAAEQAALPGGVIYSDAPANATAAAADPEAGDAVELHRGEWFTMPAGWKIGQIKAEQPTTMYTDFKHEILNEISRCLNMPYNIAAGNSSAYNYASGRLDHQAFFKSIEVDQSRLESIVLDRIFAAWSGEATQSVYGMSAVNGVPHQWMWPGYEHVDPSKEATAQATRLASNTTTLAAEYARQGRDWEVELRQRAVEKDLMKELGLDQAPTAQPEMNESKPDDDSEETGEEGGNDGEE